jgi:nucleoside-diphosphate-sugar epimerase
MITNKKVLITGGAGFIGTHIAERLVERNEVTLFDVDLANALPYSRLANDSRVRKVQGDVRDAEALQEEVSRCQILLHYASILGVRKVIDHARDTIDTVLLGTRNMLEAARHNPRIERIVNISTSEVYGNVMDAREGATCNVSTANDARVCYASSKLAAEHIVWAYHRDFKLPTVIIRPFNIFGPMRKTDNAVGRFAVRAVAGKDVTMMGDGSQLRSWCYVDDFCDAMMASIENEKAIGQDFNIGNPVTAVTIYDLAARTIRLAKSSSKISTTAHTFSDIGVRAPSSVKARELLGYVPKFDLDAGLLPTIEWYRSRMDDFREWL